METDKDLHDTLQHLRLAEDLLQRAVNGPRPGAGRRGRPDARIWDALEHVTEAGDELEELLNSRLPATHPEAFYA